MQKALDAIYFLCNDRKSGEGNAVYMETQILCRQETVVFYVKIEYDDRRDKGHYQRKDE